MLPAVERATESAPRLAIYVPDVLAEVRKAWALGVRAVKL